MENCFTQKSFFSDWLFYGDHYPSSIKQRITKETFLFATFFHISLLWSFSFYSFLNTTTLFIDLMVQIRLEILISLKHAWNNCAESLRCFHYVMFFTSRHHNMNVSSNIIRNKNLDDKNGFQLLVPCLMKVLDYFLD